MFFTALVRKQSGFTLVELMVAVAIIALLAVIGFTFFSAAQKNARDAERRSEVIAIAKAIESAQDPALNNYVYNPTVALRDFPGRTTALPVFEDPQNQPPVLNTKPRYCIAVVSTTTPPNAPNNWISASVINGCQNAPGAGQPTYRPVNASINGVVAPGVLRLYDTTNGLVRAWTLCSAMETGSNPFCIRSGNAR